MNHTENKFFALHPGDTVGISGCSNPVSRETLDLVYGFLTEKMHFKVMAAQTLAADLPDEPCSGKVKAAALNMLFSDPHVKAIFDISGGNLANEVLNHLDYSAIEKSGAWFAGYSDCTCVINAILTNAHKSSLLFQLKNIISTTNNPRTEEFHNFLFGNDLTLVSPQCIKIQGDSIDTTIVGGNIRCLLKLAGTKYFPDTNNKICNCCESMINSHYST